MGSNNLTVRPFRPQTFYCSKMKILMCLFLYCIFFTSVALVTSLKILVLMPVHGNSHYFTFKPVIEKLVERRHEVTFISPFEPKTTIKNLEYITLADPTIRRDINESDYDEASQFKPLFSFTDVDSMTGVYSNYGKVWGFKQSGFMNLTRMTCDNMLASNVMWQFMSEDRSYDLIISEAFHTNCFLGLVQKYNSPLVMLTTSATMIWYHDPFGLPSNPSYIPNAYSGFDFKMNFWERMQNLFTNTLYLLYFNYIQERVNFDLAKRVFGDNLKDFEDIVNNASLLLVNSHSSILGPRPLTPSVVEIGGVHLGTEEALPKNIEKWINESRDGVIYFSMGSMIKGHTFPEEKRKVFLRAFGRLKQRVLWKWENETMPDKPDNVMIQKWMPQFDILSHPNVKAFISHGGLLGTTEAVHCGVPVVVMPQFGDQHTNARALEAGGGGVVLNFREADEEMVYNALKTVLEPEFNKKAKELSARFRDRPMSPMDTAIYWIEYVARHKGAHHLRTAAVGMPLYQYLLLDVFGFLALCLLTTMFVFIFLIKMIIRLVMALFSLGDKKQKKQKKQ